MHYILFIMSMGPGGVTTHTQEFTSLVNCDNVVQYYNTEIYTKKNRDLGLLGEVICFPQ